MRLVVDSPAFMAQLERDVAGASRSVHAQVMSFEGDEAGKRFASLLLGRKDLERTLIIDQYSLFHISDRFLVHPKNALNRDLWHERRETLRVARQLSDDGVTVHWTNPVGVLFLEFISRNHKKAVVVDDRIVYLGGINVCDHNFAWRDVMLRIEDERVGAFMSHDIRATLRGENLPSRGDFGDLEIALLDGESNLTLYEPVLGLIREARESIVVQSAYLTFPCFDYLAEAAGRGVAVTLVTPKDNNKPTDVGLRPVGRRSGRRLGAALRRPHEPHQGHAGGRRGAGRGVVELRLPELPHQSGSAGHCPQPRSDRPVQARRAGAGPCVQRRADG